MRSFDLESGGDEYIEITDEEAETQGIECRPLEQVDSENTVRTRGPLENVSSVLASDVSDTRDGPLSISQSILSPASTHAEAYPKTRPRGGSFRAPSPPLRHIRSSASFHGFPSEGLDERPAKLDYTTTDTASGLDVSVFEDSKTVSQVSVTVATEKEPIAIYVCYSPTKTDAKASQQIKPTLRFYLKNNRHLLEILQSTEVSNFLRFQLRLPLKLTRNLTVRLTETVG